MYYAKGTKVTFKGVGPVYELTHAIETSVENFPVEVLTQEGRRVFMNVKDLCICCEVEPVVKPVQEVFPIGQKVYSKVSIGKPAEFKVSGYEYNGTGDIIRIVVKSATKKSDRTRYAYLPCEIATSEPEIDLGNTNVFELGKVKYTVQRNWELKNGERLLFFYITSKIDGVSTTIMRTSRRIHDVKALTNTLNEIWGRQ